MTIIVSESSSTSWSLIASEICRDALEHLNEYGSSETITPADQVKALRALDGVLKELPLVGYVWPKLSGGVALTWSAGTPEKVSLPTDYYNHPAVWKTINGQKIPLAQIPHGTWIGMPNRGATSSQPTHYYISPDKMLYFWPIPSADPVALLQYQRLIDDSSATAAPDVLQFWLNPLGWMVADEMSMDFGLSAPDRVEIHQRAEAKKKLALESSIPTEAVFFTVAD